MSANITVVTLNSFQNTYIGKNHLQFEQIDSTNTYAMEMITKNNPSEGTAISAAYQNAGRGQIGRDWEGQPHQNIYTTIILKPNFIEVQKQFLLNQCVAVAIGEAIECILGESISLKWPNDLYHGNFKIGGILIQNVVAGKKINFTALGMGINVNQTIFASHIPNPSSLAIIAGRNYDLMEVRQEIFRSIERWYNYLKGGESSFIKEIYLQKLYRKDLVSTFSAGGDSFKGVIRGVDQNGKLLVQQSRNIYTYNLNEIKLETE